jgi:parvulin-like peptidyl-prolyl isomerase
VVAIVNGVPILREDWERQVNQARAYLLQQPGTDLTTEAGQEALRRVQDQMLDWMIDQVLIEQAAREAGIGVKPEDVEAQIAQMRGHDAARFEAWLAANGLTLELLQSQVRTDLLTAAVRDLVTAQIPRRVAQYHVRHILVSDEVRAQAALARIRGGESFITVAREASEDDTTRNSGGNLGFLPKGVMPPAFEAAAYTLQPGEVSGVVQSEFGYHIIQLIEMEPALEVPDELWPVVQQRGFDDWLATQRANADIQRAF